jgi:hypothetical protein
MTDKEFNEKCAEYLGWIKTNESVVKGIEIIYWTDTQNNDYSYLKFHDDWNWIMLLLEAILEECSEKDDFTLYHDILDNIPDLEMTKQAIIDYWNNE